MTTLSDLNGQTLQPLSGLLDAASVPEDLVGFDRPVADLLAQVFYTNLSLHDVPNGYLGQLTLVIDQEIALAPLGDAVSLVIGGSGVAVIETEVSLAFAPGAFSFNLYFKNVDAALRIQPGLLQPLVPGTDEIDTAAGQVDIALGLVHIRIGTTQLFEIEFEAAPALPSVMIGETGVILGADAIRWLTPASENLPADTPEAFTGLYLENAAIELAALELDANPTLQAGYAFLGSQGITAQIDLLNLDLPGELGGFTFTLSDLGAEFIQNSITSAAVTGTLEVPYLDKTLQVTIGIELDGGLALAVSDPAGLAELNVPQLGTMTVHALGMEIGSESTWLLLSGSLLLEAGAPELTWPEIEVQDLRIGPDGTVELPGGWLDLQQPAALDLYGFRIEISRIGFGNEDDGRRWTGFSGGLHLVDLLPSGASVEGLRVIWDPSGNRDPQITLQGVGIELTTPGVMHLDGDVALVDEDPARFFTGSLLLELYPLGITLDAAVKIGHLAAEDLNYVYLYLSLELPVGLPLWATGAALYGLSGLYGLNVAPTASDGDWYGWYTAIPAFNIIDDSKWAGQQDASAFGAGLVLGTLFDGGWVVNTKGLLAVVMPGPVLLLHSRADLMKLPPGLLDTGEEGTFNALAVLDGNSGTLSLNIDAGWELKKIADIAASAEAYFDFANPANWHLYIGQDKPEDRRIRAWVITLFNADAYLMIEPVGIAAGFGVSWGESWKFGPVKVTLKAWVEAGAALTWSPPQLEGSLSLGGEFSVKVSLFSVGIAAEATLSAKTPKLYWVRGELEIRVKLPTPVKDLKETVTLEWKQDEPPPLEDPFTGIALEHLKVSETWPAADGNTGLLPGSARYEPGPLVPLDARPVITFDRSVEDNSGLNNIDGSTYAGPDEIGEYEFEYEVEEITLEYWPKAGAAGWQALPDHEIFGSWAAVADGQGDTSAGKLQLWTKTPFSFTRRSSRAYRDWFLSRFPLWPCPGVPTAEEICVEWFGMPDGEELGEVFNHQGLAFNADISPTIVQSTAETVCRGSDESAMHFHYNLWALFPEEKAYEVDICIEGRLFWLRTYADGEPVHLVQDPEDQMVRLRGAGIEWIHFEGPEEGAVVVSICYKTESQFLEAERQQERIDRLEASTVHWESEEPILAPDIYYRLGVTVKTTRTGRGNTETRTETHQAYFQTMAPPALDPAIIPPGGDALGVTHYPNGDRWKDLGAYIDQLIPGEGALPVYRAYGFGVEFNEDYVEQMYGADMAIRLQDGNDLPVTDEHGNDVLFANVWEEMPTTELSETEYPYVERLSACLPAWTAYYPPNDRFAADHGVLFEDDFSAGLDAWTDPSEADGDPNAKWTAAGGVLSLLNPALGGLGNLLVAGDQDWDDVAVEIDLAGQGDDIGLVFRYTNTDAERYYRLRLNAAERKLEKIDAGVVEVLWEEAVGYTPGDAAALAVQCVGGQLRGQLDDLLLFDLQDEAALLTGQVGIFALASAAFKRLLVRDWPGAVLAPETHYTAELLASYVRMQAATWPADPSGEGWFEMAEVIKRFVLKGDESWADVRIEASVTIDTAERAGLVVRFSLDPGTNTYTCYRLFFNPEDRKLRLAHLTGDFDPATGEFTITERDPFWECLDPACGVDFDLTEHDLALSCEGPLLTIEVDGQLIAIVEDERLAAGQAGLYYSGNEDPVFSDIVVRSRPRGVVQRWQFTSSAFAGLVEHLDGFNGQVYLEEADVHDTTFKAVWDPAVLEVDAALQALEAARLAVENAGPEDVWARRAEAEAAEIELNRASGVQFEALSGLLFPGVYRPRPPRVELTAVHGTYERHALLLESPEPLDWARITPRLRQLTPNGYVDVKKDFTFIWSADGAQAYLALSDDAGIGNGDFEIQIARRLDIGPAGPVLRRCGSTLPEVGGLKFELD